MFIVGVYDDFYNADFKLNFLLNNLINFKFNSLGGVGYKDVHCIIVKFFTFFKTFKAFLISFKFAFPVLRITFLDFLLLYFSNLRLSISDEAIFNKESFKTTFSKNVKLLYQEQLLESDNLEFLFDKNIAIFKDNVKYYNQDIEMFADIVNINLLTREIDIRSKNQKKIKIKKKN